MTSEGKILGIGHAETPESIYENPQLFPSMLPWLFPYGLGGIGHTEHEHKLSSMMHKRYLLCQNQNKTTISQSYYAPGEQTEYQGPYYPHDTLVMVENLHAYHRYAIILICGRTFMASVYTTRKW